jgi:peptidoglycan lytic transglycosylase
MAVRTPPVPAGRQVDGNEEVALTPRSTTIVALGATGLTLATANTSAEPAQAQAAAEPAAPAITVSDRRLNVRAGRRIVVRGTAQPSSTVSLQIQRAGRWRTLARARTGARGAFTMRDRTRRPLSARARLRAPGATRSLGRLNVYRTALASWYGPGLYGQRLGCGGTLSAGSVGVAHKSLPCGTRVTLRHRGRILRVRVIDRGPYVGGREYDLTAATARRLGFSGHGAILTTR